MRKKETRRATPPLTQAARIRQRLQPKARARVTVGVRVGVETKVLPSVAFRCAIMTEQK